MFNFLHNGNDESFNADRAQLHSALENTGTNIFFADRDLTLLYMNEKSQKTLEAINDILQDELL